MNVGGNKQTVFNFAKKYNKNIGKISARNIFEKLSSEAINEYKFI